MGASRGQVAPPGHPQTRHRLSHITSVLVPSLLHLNPFIQPSTYHTLTLTLTLNSSHLTIKVTCFQVLFADIQYSSMAGAHNITLQQTTWPPRRATSIESSNIYLT